MCLPHIGPRTQGALPGPNRILEGYCDPLAEGVTGLFQAGKRLWARQKQTTEAVIVTGNRVVKASGTSVDLEMGIDKLDSRRVAVLMVDKNCLVDLGELCISPKSLVFTSGVTSSPVRRHQCDGHIDNGIATISVYHPHNVVR
jgi:hypothetical protein